MKKWCQGYCQKPFQLCWRQTGRNSACHCYVAVLGCVLSFGFALGLTLVPFCARVLVEWVKMSFWCLWKQTPRVQLSQSSVLNGACGPFHKDSWFDACSQALRLPVQLLEYSREVNRAIVRLCENVKRTFWKRVRYMTTLLWTILLGGYDDFILNVLNHLVS